LPNLPSKAFFKKSKSVVASRVTDLEKFLTSIIELFIKLDNMEVEVHIEDFLEVHENVHNESEIANEDDDAIDNSTLSSFGTMRDDLLFRNDSVDAKFHAQLVNNGQKRHVTAAVFTMCVMIFSLVVGNLYQLVDPSHHTNM
jgi:hypothetical protein